jgi:hypothetical protein
MLNLTKNEMVDRMIEVLTESYLLYAGNPDARGTDGQGGCYYKEPKTGKMCSIGRCMLPSQVGPHLSGTIEELIDERLDEGVDTAWGDLDGLLRKRYRGLPLTFWQALQEWHDDDHMWFPNASHQIDKVVWGTPDLVAVHKAMGLIYDNVVREVYCTRA